MGSTGRIAIGRTSGRLPPEEAGVRTAPLGAHRGNGRPISARSGGPCSPLGTRRGGLLLAPTPARVAGAANLRTGRSRAADARPGQRGQLEAGAARRHAALVRRSASPPQSRGQQGGRAGDAEGRTVTMIGKKPKVSDTPSLLPNLISSSCIDSQKPGSVMRCSSIGYSIVSRNSRKSMHIGPVPLWKKTSLLPTVGEPGTSGNSVICQSLSTFGSSP
jgi:hypothetical protein